MSIFCRNAPSHLEIRLQQVQSLERRLVILKYPLLSNSVCQVFTLVHNSQNFPMGKVLTKHVEWLNILSKPKRDSAGIQNVSLSFSLLQSAVNWNKNISHKYHICPTGVT